MLENNINNRIKVLRSELKLSQKDFASLIGVKQNTVSTMEKSGSTVKEQNIITICEKFNVNKEWLKTGIGGEENMFNPISPISQTYNHFSYMMKNASAQKKAVLTALVEMAYSIDDEKWQYICDQFQQCLDEGKKER